MKSQVPCIKLQLTLVIALEKNITIYDVIMLITWQICTDHMIICHKCKKWCHKPTLSLILLLCKGFFSCLEFELIKDSFCDVRGHMWGSVWYHFFKTKVGANFHGHTLSEPGVIKKCLEQNVWNYILSKFKLQSRFFMGIISLTIAGSVIRSDQERMVQSGYFFQSSKLLKNICE